MSEILHGHVEVVLYKFWDQIYLYKDYIIYNFYPRSNSLYLSDYIEFLYRIII